MEDGLDDGTIEGRLVGPFEGRRVGPVDGFVVGSIDTVIEGAVEGMIVGFDDKTSDGAVVGIFVGILEGFSSEGEVVGLANMPSCAIAECRIIRKVYNTKRSIIILSFFRETL